MGKHQWVSWELEWTMRMVEMALPLHSFHGMHIPLTNGENAPNPPHSIHTTRKVHSSNQPGNYDPATITLTIG